jgi:8-hydroxy-5-deazaflavin:NADPH oxidoreductase
MNITIIGKGKVGTALGENLRSHGHVITYAGRDNVREASKGADVIIVAASPAGTFDIIDALLPVADGVVIIDAMNSVSKRLENYPTTTHAFATLLPNAKVVKCFNTVGFETMGNPVYGEVHADMFMAGDNSDAKSVADQLARDCGFGVCHDVGGSNRWETLEHLAMVWISLAMFQGKGRAFAWHLVERP